VLHREKSKKYQVEDDLCVKSEEKLLEPKSKKMPRLNFPLKSNKQEPEQANEMFNDLDEAFLETKPKQTLHKGTSENEASSLKKDDTTFPEQEIGTDSPEMPASSERKSRFRITATPTSPKILKTSPKKGKKENFLRETDLVTAQQPEAVSSMEESGSVDQVDEGSSKTVRKSRFALLSRKKDDHLAKDSKDNVEGDESSGKKKNR